MHVTNKHLEVVGAVYYIVVCRPSGDRSGGVLHRSVCRPTPTRWIGGGKSSSTWSKQEPIQWRRHTISGWICVRLVSPLKKLETKTNWIFTRMHMRNKRANDEGKQKKTQPNPGTQLLCRSWSFGGNISSL